MCRVGGGDLTVLDVVEGRNPGACCIDVCTGCTEVGGENVGKGCGGMAAKSREGLPLMLVVDDADVCGCKMLKVFLELVGCCVGDDLLRLSACFGR